MLLSHVLQSFIFQMKAIPRTWHPYMARPFYTKLVGLDKLEVLVVSCGHCNHSDEYVKVVGPVVESLFILGVVPLLSPSFFMCLFVNSSPAKSNPSSVPGRKLTQPACTTASSNNDMTVNFHRLGISSQNISCEVSQVVLHQGQ